MMKSLAGVQKTQRGGFGIHSIVFISLVSSLWAARPGFVCLDNGNYVPSQIQSDHYRANTLGQCFVVTTDSQWHYCPVGQYFDHRSMTDNIVWSESYSYGPAWTVVWESDFILFESETVDFKVGFDQWVILYVDGGRVFEEAGTLGVKDRIVSLNLNAGVHHLKLVYYDDFEGGGHLYMAWSSPTIPNSMIGPAIMPACAEILNNAIIASLVSGGKGLWARFQPNYNKTLQEAARNCGYDHFNWLQWVTYDDDPMRPPVQEVQPNAPYIDPPYGGYDYMTTCGGADYNPGYWNENGIGCSDYQLSRFSFSNYLEFRDFPMVSAAPFKVRFKTALIGVKNGGRPVVIGNWIRWECTAVGLKSVRQNLDETLIISPGVALDGIIPVSALEPADIAFLADNGIDVDPYPCGYPPLGDFDEDCRVDLSDLNILARNWLASDSVVDTNADNVVNILDLAAMAENWLIDCNISTGHPACPIQ